MFTKNFYNLLASYGVNAGQGSNNGYPSRYVNGTLGYIARPTSTSFPYTSPRVSSNINSEGVYFGSGTTPASEDDYTLESLIGSGLTVTQSNTSIFEEGKMKRRCVYTLTNTSSSNITVGELGVVSLAYSGSGSQTYFLWLREVFGPVVIPPGSSQAITLTIVSDREVQTSLT